MPEQHPALTTAIGLTSLTYGLIFFSVLAARILPPHELENQRQGYDLLAIRFCSNSAVLYSGLVKRAWPSPQRCSGFRGPHLSGLTVLQYTRGVRGVLLPSESLRLGEIVLYWRIALQ